MMNFFLVITILILETLVSVQAKSISDKPNTHNLFRIERSRSNDQVLYDLNLTLNGCINQIDPLKVYWHNPRKGKNQKLTSIQNNYGYGVELTNCCEHSVSFKIKAIPNQIFEVKKTNAENYSTYSFVDNEELLIDFIYIKFVEGTVWIPEIEKVELNAFQTTTMQPILKTINQK